MAVDWKEIEGDSKEKYGLYLCSREWSELKRAVHERAGGLCERCGRNPIDAVHHLTYERKYSELLEDLQAICDPCHDFTHGHSDYDPRVIEKLVQEIVFGKQKGFVELEFGPGSDAEDGYLLVVFKRGNDRIGINFTPSFTEEIAEFIQRFLKDERC